MPSTGVIKGRTLRAYNGGNAIAYATNCSLSISAEELEVIHKDNAGAGWRSISSGQKSGTLTVDALYAEDGANNTPDDIFEALSAGTELSMKVDTGVSGDHNIAFTAVCTSFEVNADVSDNASYSATFTITGAVTMTTT